MNRERLKREEKCAMAVLGALQAMSHVGALSTLCMLVDYLAERLEITPRELTELIADMAESVEQDMGKCESSPIHAVVKEVQ